MTPNQDQPVIIVGCANSYQEPQRQLQLRRERETVTHILGQTQGVLPPELIKEDPETGQYLFDLLRGQQFRWNAAVLHLAGYSEGQYLHLEGGLGEEPLKANDLAQMISRLPGLRMVFLNGCATPELVRQLLRRDIPAVLATQATQKRMHHGALAFSFYEALGQGQTLMRAFRQLHRATPELVGYYPVSYDLERDDFFNGELWLSEIGDEHLPGGLYMQADREDELNWKLKSSTQKQPPQPEKEEENPSSGKKRVGIGLLVALLLVLIGVVSSIV